MPNVIMLAILAGGIILLVFGINASHSLGSDVSQIFTGSPTDKSMWMIIGGIIAIIVGLGGVVKGVFFKH
jgi:hypothetical protein